MTALAQASAFNAEASLNAWMLAALQAYVLPTWLPTMPAFVFDAPAVSANLPCFSLIHIPVDVEQRYQGRQVGAGKLGGRATGMFDVSCWVSRSLSPYWAAQLRTMRAMVISTAQSQGIQLFDYAVPAAPVGTIYKVNIDGLKEVPTQADSNPDVMRARVLVDYSYVARST